MNASASHAVAATPANGAAEFLPIDFGGPSQVAFDPFDEYWAERPILERFEAIVAGYPDKIAVDDGVMRLTYRDLLTAALHLAERIEMIVPPGRPVGILLPNTALVPIAIIACFAIGRIAVPIDLSYPDERNQQVVDNSKLAAIIIDCDEDGIRIVPASVPRLDIKDSLYRAGVRANAFATAGQPAVVLHTSGSTGRPKGICNHQGAILQRVIQFTNACHLNVDDRFILLSSPGTIAGIRDMFAALLNAATLYIADPHKLGMSGLLKVLQDNQITICYAVPALLGEVFCLPNAKRACRSLRVVRLGGDAVRKSTINLCRNVLSNSCHVLIGYGSTEAPTIFQWFVPPEWTTDSPRVPIGYPVPGTRIALLRDDGNQAAAGETAEIVVRSRYVALGVWQNGHLIAGPFQSDPDDPLARIWKSGDLVQLRDDGLADLVGRKDRQIKIRGYRVNPDEIEGLLRNSDRVTDAVVARSGEGESAALVAYVETSASDATSLGEDLRRAFESRLPKYMRPTRIHFLNSIPRLPGYKPDIVALEKLEAQTSSSNATAGASATTVYPSPATPLRITRAVEYAWVETFDQRPLNPGTSWADAGGDSLKALRFWFIVEERLGIRLPLDVLGEDARPSDVAEAINKSLNSAPVSEILDRAEPIVYFMPPYEGDVPALVRFRSAFGGRIQFQVIQYPSWRDMTRKGAGLGRIVDDAVAQIIARTGTRPCCLAGYSFGGFVAWETARRLLERGCRVNFVGLIDTRRRKSLEARRNWALRAHAVLREILGRRANLESSLSTAIFRVLIEVSAYPVLRAMGQLAMLLPTKAAFAVHSNLIAALRLKSIEGWTLTPLSVSTTLFRSNEFSLVAPDLGWSSLASNLTVIPMSGSHTSMFEMPDREILSAHFEREMDKAIALAAPALDLSQPPGTAQAVMPETVSRFLGD